MKKKNKSSSPECLRLVAVGEACVPRPYGLCWWEFYVPGRASEAGQTVREKPD